MTSQGSTPAGGADLRPHRASRPRVACGLLVWIQSEGEAPTFYQAKRRQPKVRGIARAYSLTKPGSSEGYTVTLGPNGPHCTCQDFAYGQARNGAEGCKHCRALADLGLL